MKNNHLKSFNLRQLALATGAALALAGSVVRASQAYGTINNFDVVNDTSNQCHGFEIELDDLHGTDITYTYDYNHYGVPKITGQSAYDATLGAWHTNVFVVYNAVWTNTGWSACTAVPSSNIPPTMGHQFTNPNLNFGGEHFGVGYTKNPGKVLYFWMTDNGAHTLTRSGQVYVSTPTFTYNPPAAAGQPAAAQAVIPAPILPMSYVCPNPEFSDAVWCKVITTTSQTNSPVSIKDLMTPDTNNPNAKDWRNGQINIEVETEWQLLQIDYMSSDYNPTNGLGGQKPSSSPATPISPPATPAHCHWAWRLTRTMPCFMARRIQPAFSFSPSRQLPATTRRPPKHVHSWFPPARLLRRTARSIALS